MIILHKNKFPLPSIAASWPAVQAIQTTRFQAMPIRFDIIDTRTKKVVGTAQSRKRAAQSADKRDMAYGAIRYSVRAVYA